MKSWVKLVRKSLLIFGGATVMVASVGVRPAAAATLDLKGNWKSVAHCTKGWCNGSDFPASMVITSFDAATGKLQGTYAGAVLTGVYEAAGRKLTTHEGNGYTSDSVGTLSDDGKHSTGTWTDSNGVGGTYKYDFDTALGAGAAGAVAATPPAAAPKPGGAKPVTEFSTTKGRSGLLAIPNPGKAITLKNVGLAAAVTLALFALIGFPSTLFNSTLEANIDDIRRRLPKWMTGRKLVEGAAVGATGGAAVAAADPDGSEPPPPPAAGPGFWQKPQGFATFVGLAALLYSRMQPEFGANTATVHTFLGFVIGVTVSTMIGVTVSRVYLKKKFNGGGHLEVEFATLIFAFLCVVVSRLANFVPGYFYGVIALFVASVDPPEEHKGRMTAIGTMVTFVVAVGAWLLMGPIDSLNATGALPSGLLRSLDGGLFGGGVEALAIGLTPIKFLPGATLKKWNSKVWLGFYGAALFLFCLAMLHPGLAHTETKSITVTLVFCGVFMAISVAFWNYYRVKTSTTSTPATAQAVTAGDTEMIEVS